MLVGLGAQPAPAQRTVSREWEGLTSRFFGAVSEVERKRAAADSLRFAREHDLVQEGEQEMRLYLIAQANEELASSEPYPLELDASGYSLPDLSQEFVAWASAQGLDPEVAGAHAIYEAPLEVGRLIGDTDPATLAVFGDALEAENHLVVIMAAWGLAAAKHTESIEAIVEAAASSPAEIALNLARALDEFGDPEADAQAASIRAEHQ